MHEPYIKSISSKDKKLNLDVCASIGGSITRFYIKSNTGAEIDLFRPYDPKLSLSALNFASFPLTPFSNRIANGVLNFRGESYEVGPKFKQENHPNHGDGWTSSWTVVDESENEIVLYYNSIPKDNSPYVYEAWQKFSLEDDQLKIDIKIKNLQNFALPFGTGHHLYFQRTEKTFLKSNLKRVWFSKEMIPTELHGIPQKWHFEKGLILSKENLQPAEHGADGSAYIDHCFTGWDGTAEIYWPEFQTKLTMVADPIFGSFVIYIPADDSFFCAEPVTNVTDGFNLMEKGEPNTGAIVLNPNEIISGSVLFKPQIVSN